jgi:oligopeptide transport system permease protein
MTLCILKLGSSFQTFAIALCLTGWMGTSSITRTQFYRFKDREYIFAARTLGASDNRLIFRHILPNAVGTIITSSVLMIPSVIFSEATISYLGLGLQGLSSLGVTLSENQIHISTNPYLIVFPSVIMALMMISFNLFGNGLRDAFNPSLKGED